MLLICQQFALFHSCVVDAVEKDDDQRALRTPKNSLDKFIGWMRAARYWFL